MRPPKAVGGLKSEEERKERKKRKERGKREGGSSELTGHFFACYYCYYY